MQSGPSSRLAYIDWLRGLACVLMFQTHCYDAWLGGSARTSNFAMWSQLLGTFPAPLFLFLAGISAALVADKQLQKGVAAPQIGKKIIVRGAQILGLGLLFRVQEFAISWRWAPWTDLFRVDILNTIGVSIMLMGAMCWVATVIMWGRASSPVRRNAAPQAPLLRCAFGPDSQRVDARCYRKLIVLATFCAAIVAAVTPLLWSTWRPRFLPWELETYINGVHNLGTPQAWLFPIFPWAGFAFAGLAMGFILMSDVARQRGWIFLLSGLTGVALIYTAKFVDSRGWKIYPVYDYWHTSPSFFVARVGWLLLLVLLAYAWCRWGLGQLGFSPLIQMGTTSLLVYWVHIEFVYGRFRILPHRTQTILGASKGLLIIFLSMLLLSLFRTKWKAHTPQLFVRRKARPVGRKRVTS